MTMMDYVDIGTRSATQGQVGKVIVHMQKGNRMKLKDADKIKEAGKGRRKPKRTDLGTRAATEGRIRKRQFYRVNTLRGRDFEHEHIDGN